MSALDRALIRAYRQQRGGAASYQPPATVPAVQPHTSHSAEPVLAGPHFRIDAPHVGEVSVKNADVAAGQWTTFRVDVGAIGVPTGPKGSQPAPEETTLTSVATSTESTATTIASPSAQPTRARTKAKVNPAPAAQPAVVRTIIHPAPAAEIPPAASSTSLAESQPDPTPDLVFKCGFDRPQLIVDQFHWPELCDELARKLVTGGVRLTEALRLQEHRAVAFVGTDSGAGVTTALLTVARQLTAEGMRSTIVDADFRNPDLAELLSVRVAQGWDALIAGRVTLDEVAIESIGDKMVLAPLTPACGIERDLASSRVGGPIWSMLRKLGDVLLIDAGAIELSAPLATLNSLYKAADLDGVFLVCDCRVTTPQQVIGLTRDLKSAGITVLGTIENFCPDQAA